MSEVNWSVDARNALGVYATLNWPFGLWPLSKVDLFLKIRLMVGILLMIIQVIGVVYEMYQNCGNAEDVLDSLLIIAAGVTASSKLIIYHIHRDKLKTNIVSALQDWSSPDAVNYRKIMKSYERMHKNVTFVLLTVVMCSGFVYILKILVIDPDEMIQVNNDNLFPNVTHSALKKRYLYPSSCTLIDISDFIHLVIILNQIVQIMTCCIVAVGSDTFFLTITVHLSGQFEILKVRFANVGKDKNSIVMESRENIAILISRHQHLLQLTALLEAAYNKIVLTQMLMGVVIITTAGFSFLLDLQAGNLIGSMKSLLFMQYMLLQIFMYACIGDILKSQGDDITQSVYKGSWYKLPGGLSKDLVFVMMRSNVSTHLTAGKFCNMTRDTFIDVIKASSSYLSLLRIMLIE